MHRGRAGTGSAYCKGVTSFSLAGLDSLADISYLSAGFETKDYGQYMKMKWLFLMFYVGITINVLAQDIYVPGKIAEGKSAAYHCVTNGIFLRLYNVNNSDTTWIMVYKNGESASTYEPEALPLFKQEELIEIFCSELTAEELDKIRGKYGYFLGLMIVCDSEGNAEEINFWFRNNDPILLAFSPDRFYGLEQRLKEVLKVRLSTTDRTIESIKYVEAIGYKDID